MAALRLSVSSLVLCNIGRICKTRSSASAWHRGCISSWPVPGSPAPSSSSWTSSKVVMYWLITRSQSRPKVLQMKGRVMFSTHRKGLWWTLQHSLDPKWNFIFHVETTMWHCTVSNWPAVLEDNVWGDPLVFHQIRDQTALHLRPLTEHWLDGYLRQSRDRRDKSHV